MCNRCNTWTTDETVFEWCTNHVKVSPVYPFRGRKLSGCYFGPTNISLFKWTVFEPGQNYPSYLDLVIHVYYKSFFGLDRVYYKSFLSILLKWLKTTYNFSVVIKVNYHCLLHERVTRSSTTPGISGQKYIIFT